MNGAPGTLKRDDDLVTALHGVRTATDLVDRWVTDCDTINPHSALRKPSLAEFRAALGLRSRQRGKLLPGALRI